MSERSAEEPRPDIRARNAEFNRRASEATRLGVDYGLRAGELESFMSEWLERHAVLTARVVDAKERPGHKAVLMLPTYVEAPTAEPIDHGRPYRRALRYAQVFGEMAGWVAGGLILIGIGVATLRALLLG